VISGDTKPCDQIIAFSEDADILIHEATFDSRLQDIAKEYGHTTASQAAEIAEKARVEKLFLVHISPRYLDFHVLEDEARSVFAHSYVPKDFQEVEVKLKK
jgi:ribonuclease Z